MSVVRPLFLRVLLRECAFRKGLYIRRAQKPSGTNLLDEHLKDFIVNPADLPRLWIKRLATSGERVNHGSW